MLAILLINVRWF